MYIYICTYVYICTYITYVHKDAYIQIRIGLDIYIYL